MFNHISKLCVPKSVKELYANKVLRDLGFSMINIFIPIYLFQTGFEFFEVLSFLLLWYMLQAPLFVIVAGLNAVIRMRSSMVFASVMSIVSLLLLLVLPNAKWLFYLVAVSLALQESFYWQTFHTDFAKHINKRYSGEEVGILFALVRIISVIGPILGAFIIVFLGYNILLGIASLLFTISVLPLLNLEKRKEPITIVPQLLKGVKPFIHLFFVNSFVSTANAIIWPIFVFIHFGSLLHLGYLFALGYLATAIIAMKVGDTLKNKNLNKFIRIGAVLVSISWIMRYFSDTIWNIYPTQLLFESFFLFLAIPEREKMYEKAKATNPSDFIVFRESIFTISRMLLFGLLFFMDIRTFFIVAAGIALSGFFIKFNTE